MNLINALTLVLTLVVLVRSQPEPCPNGGHFVPNFGCVKFIPSLFPITWDGAALFCNNSAGGELLVVPNAEIHDAIIELVEGTQQSYWIGLTDERNEGSWVDGGHGEEAPYLAWAPGQPDGGPVENCAMITSLSNYWFIDENCDYGGIPLCFEPAQE